MKESNITVSEFYKKEYQVLTLAKAKELKGHKIAWTYEGYEHNQQVVFEMTVGDIISTYDYHKHQPMEGYASRADYWDKILKPAQLQNTKDDLYLLDEQGSNRNFIVCHTGMYNCFDEFTFTCSDADRAVLFIQLD